MLAVTVAHMVNSKFPIFDNALQHFQWYLVDDTSNVGFQFLNRSRFIHADFGLYINPKEKV